MTTNNWEELVDRVHQAAVKYLSDLEPAPAPLGATEDQISDAEKRLGYALDPEYREFLAVANGWAKYDGMTTLFSAEQFGVEGIWTQQVALLREVISVFDASHAGFGIPVALLGFVEDFLHIVVVEQAPGGKVHRINSGGITTFSGFAEFLENKLTVFAHMQ
ncbi:MAG: SMI1/KNR4 family protein [Mycobacteriaceae bacterium]